MPTRLLIDRNACIGSGLCAAMHPELFRLTDEGLAEPVVHDLTHADDIEFAQDVSACCPGEAVVVREPAE